VETVRRQAENDVADLDLLAGDDSLFFDHAEDESGQIVLAPLVNAGQLRRFATDQRAFRSAACSGESAQ